MGVKRKDGTRFVKYECHQRHPRKTIGATTYNGNKKCDSGFYYKDDLEAYVLQEISKLQVDKESFEGLFKTKKDEIDRKAYQRQINELTGKISRLNDLYIDNRITLEQLQGKSAEFLEMRSRLENELENDPALKRNEKKEDMRRILGKDDIYKMDYEMQASVVRSLISKVQVTAECIKILWRI